MPVACGDIQYGKQAARRRCQWAGRRPSQRSPEAPVEGSEVDREGGPGTAVLESSAPGGRFRMRGLSAVVAPRRRGVRRRAAATVRRSAPVAPRGTARFPKPTVRTAARPGVRKEGRIQTVRSGFSRMRTLRARLYRTARPCPRSKPRPCNLASRQYGHWPPRMSGTERLPRGGAQRPERGVPGASAGRPSPGCFSVSGALPEQARTGGRFWMALENSVSRCRYRWGRRSRRRPLSRTRSLRVKGAPKCRPDGYREITMPYCATSLSP